MPESELTPDELLFTDLDGNRQDLQDVIYNGLDEDYSGRHAALVQLLREGQPNHRLWACVMLASWGVDEGLRTIVQWASDPDATPWAGEPFTFERFSGADAAFEMLAHAVEVAGDVEPRPELVTLRTAAVRALLAIYHRVSFARSLYVLLDIDDALADSLRQEVAAAIRRAIATSQAQTVGFDLPTQAAFLIGPLARVDDEQAAQATTALLAAHPDHARAIREAAYALGSGSGPATRALLEQLAISPFNSVRQDAQEALARRA